MRRLPRLLNAYDAIAPATEPMRVCQSRGCREKDALMGRNKYDGTPSQHAASIFLVAQNMAKNALVRLFYIRPAPAARRWQRVGSELVLEPGCSYPPANPMTPDPTAMRPSAALDAHRPQVRQLVAHYKSANPRVFGSTAAGRDTESSDLDLLVDPLPGTTLLDLGGLQVALEDVLGVPVDVRTPRDLPDSFRQRVLASALPV